MPAIHARLTADPGTYPPADPETGWTLGGLYSILANPKYTGYQVFGRTRKGKPVPPGQWYWPDQRTHPAIVDRELASRPEGRGRAPQLTRRRHPQPGQLAQLPVPVPGPLQDLQAAHVRADQGARANKTPTEYAYYVCQYNPRTPSHVAAAPDHPRTCRSGKTVLLAETFRGLRPTRWPPAGNSASPSSSRTPPPPGKPSTTARPPPWPNGSSGSPPGKTT